MNIRPAEDHYNGVYFDGQVSVRREAGIHLTPGGVQIQTEAWCVLWRYKDITVMQDGFYGEAIRLENKAYPDAALLVSNSSFAISLDLFAPELLARPFWDLRLTGWQSIIQTSAAVALLAAFFYYYGIALVAEAGVLIAPRAAEERMGHSAVQFITATSKPCNGSASTKLLRRLEAPIFKAAGTDYPLEVIYVRMPMVNAFAAPGGKIVVSSGLVEHASKPDELAGVLAHEVQHVLHRDSMRAIARQLGGSVILAMLAVDPSSSNLFLNPSSQLLQLSFSREAETQADLGAVELLGKAGYAKDGITRALNHLLELKGDDSKSFQYLSTHPSTTQRIETLRRVAPEATPPNQLLTDEEWARAKRVCVDP